MNIDPKTLAAVREAVSKPVNGSRIEMIMSFAAARGFGMSEEVLDILEHLSEEEWQRFQEEFK